MTPRPKTRREALAIMEAGLARVRAAILRLKVRLPPSEERTRLVYGFEREADKIALKITKLRNEWRRPAVYADDPAPANSSPDLREQIRESRAYEATTGPPRGGTTNENGPPGSGAPERAESHGSPSNRLTANCTANLPCSTENSQPDFSGNGELRPKTRRKSGAAGLENDEVRHENSPKPH